MIDAGPPVGATAAARPADIDVAVAPIDATTPIVAAGPAPERVAGAEGNSGREEAGADIAGRRPVIRRIIGIRPIAIDDARVIIGNIDRIGIRWLDGDDLLVLHFRYSDGLLFGRLQLVVGLSLGAQALDRVHHIGLLGNNRIAELLRPIEFRTHHLQHVRRGDQGFDAVVPRLLVDRRLQCIAFEILVCFKPTLGLHDVERIGRRHQHLGEQRIRIKRDRRNQLIELGGFQQLGIRCGGWRRRGLRHRTGRYQDDCCQCEPPNGRQNHVRLPCCLNFLTRRLAAAHRTRLFSRRLLFGHHYRTVPIFTPVQIASIGRHSTMAFSKKILLSIADEVIE